MSDASNSGFGGGFGKFVPGFEFLQNLAGQAAGGVAQGLGQSIPQLPNLSNWVAPTFNVEELEKRIEELKAVHFWLDQNAKALGATIQALEVQKMTLATLKNMNFSLGDVANALKIKAADTMAGFGGTSAPPPAAAPAHTPFAGLEIPPRTYGTPTPEPEPAQPATAPEADPEPPRSKQAPRRPAQAAAAPPAGGVVDPMQWWGALSQQFQNIAATAMKDVARQTALDTTRQVASGLTEQAVKTATGVAGKVTRTLSDTVARNAGAAVGAGQSVARAVGQAGASARGKAAPRPAAKGQAKAAVRAPAPKAQKAAKPTKAAQPAAAPRRRAAAETPAAVQPLSTGDWPLPGAFFPGFAALRSEAAAPPTATASVRAPVQRAAAKKAPAKKAPVRRR